MNFKHGYARRGTRSPEYDAYESAKGRCTRPTHKQFVDYGGRGIKFLFTSFEQFIEHLGSKPSPKFELDRIENDGHYEVGNVRWSLPRVSSINRRQLKSNTSGFRGVCATPNNRWRAFIRNHGKRHALGTFSTAVAAAHAYDTAAKELHGEHAHLNF